MLPQIKATYSSILHVPPGADFSDATLLQYADYYAGGEEWEVVSLVLKTCVDRLCRRANGTPHHDDPIGKAAAPKANPEPQGPEPQGGGV